MSDLHNYIDMMLNGEKRFVISAKGNRVYVNIGYFTSDYLIAMFDRETGDFIQYVKN